jgi:hypothetical protein
VKINPVSYFRRLAFTALISLGILAGSIGIHEIGHQLFAKMLGIEGHIQLHFSSGLFRATEPTPWLVGAGGGITAGVFVLIFFWLAAYISPTIYDTYLELAAILVAFGHFGYAWIEVKWKGEEWWWMAFAVTAVVYGITLFLYRWKLVEWLTANGKRRVE